MNNKHKTNHLYFLKVAPIAQEYCQTDWPTNFHPQLPKWQRSDWIRLALSSAHQTFFCRIFLIIAHKFFIVQQATLPQGCPCFSETPWSCFLRQGALSCINNIWTPKTPLSVCILGTNYSCKSSLQVCWFWLHSSATSGPLPESRTWQKINLAQTDRWQVNSL